MERDISKNISIYAMAVKVLLFCGGLTSYPEQIDRAIDDLKRESEKMLLCTRLQLENVSKS